MISPQLNPDSSTSCPPGSLHEPFNVSMNRTPLPDGPRLVAAMGADMESRATTDALVTGLWHCLWGSLAAGLGVSMLLGVLVLALSQIG
jgi:hypothetical protein